MTEIPDAEPMWAEPLKQWQETWKSTSDIPGATKSFLAGFAAAEGPWREHLATQLEAVAEGIETNDQEYESGQRWAFFDAARIVRGTNE